MTTSSNEQNIIVLIRSKGLVSTIETAVRAAGGHCVVVENIESALERAAEASIALVEAAAFDIAAITKNLRSTGVDVVAIVDDEPSERTIEAWKAGATTLIWPLAVQASDLADALRRLLERSTRNYAAFLKATWDINESFLKNMVLLERRNMELEEELNSTGQEAIEEGKPKAILVVEDERDVAQFMMDMLQVTGYQVTVAANGMDALELFFDHRYDLVLTDKNLPGMTGIELTRSLKQVRKDVPVIMVTGYATVESAIEAVDLGMAAYIQKPFSSKELLNKVAKILEDRAKSERAKQYLMRFKTRNKEFLDQYRLIRMELRHRLTDATGIDPDA
ncbi:MAG: response regulator [Deltaproteobacteria bacterium]|nr:response regulator [Deltaproteobacteria bacterium]